MKYLLLIQFIYLVYAQERGARQSTTIYLRSETGTPLYIKEATISNGVYVDTQDFNKKLSLEYINNITFNKDLPQTISARGRTNTPIGPKGTFKIQTETNSEVAAVEFDIPFNPAFKNRVILYTNEKPHLNICGLQKYNLSAKNNVTININCYKRVQ